ncbi:MULTISPECIES: hypothetical protein [Streptomyces]|uniref:hypothetical protein n=1 Tax=Streptomyces TaxID=1883 RepID=UPI0007857248|nr:MULTISPECIES: hypothetical protein [Streptomyces]KYK14236.1 hypothetical protein AUW26_28095 [Streptomyces sp. CC71]
MTDDLAREMYLAETAVVREHLAEHDQTTPLRDRIAEAALAAVEAALGDTLVPAARAEALAGIAAVLPAPVDRAADLAAALDEDLRYVLDYRGPGHAHERPGFWDTSGRPCMHCARLAVARMNLADHDAELRRVADETATTETQARRGDAFEAWLKAQRDDHPRSSHAWFMVDCVLDRYRLHADTGTPLGEHVCEARVVGDCECLEQPAAGARQDGARP